MKKLVCVLLVVCVLFTLSISAFAANTSSDSATLKDVLEDLIGEYTPEVVEVEYTEGEEILTKVEVKNDYVWLASFVLVALVIYCLFRLGGAMLG